MTRAFVNRIGTAVPDHDIHAEFVAFAATVLPERHRELFGRMAEMADIEHRYSIFAPGPKPRDTVLDADSFYQRGGFPSTAARMDRYAEPALALARQAVGRLALDAEAEAITHLIAVSCTGFTAPGLDFHLAQALGLPGSVERTLVGFMGCSAAVNALRLARHILRSEPDAKVLVVNLELASLHLQERWGTETMLMFLLFGDGCTASLVSAEPTGIELGEFRAAVIPDTADFITWHIRDQGFDMRLSGQVPVTLRRWLRSDEAAGLLPEDRSAIALWAVHAGGRSILDAVQDSLGLPPPALGCSRAVLRDFGNMSSATLMFVLDRIMREQPAGADGLAMAFGPGLSVETFRFRRAG